MGLLNDLVAEAASVLSSVTETLGQQKTNGASLLGTLVFPFLPFFLTNNPLPSGFPWGGLNDWNSNPYVEYPRTGVIRSYDFTVSRGFIAPDGYQRPVLLVNGAYPGPLIEANWGDKIVVTVHNNITGPEEGTAIHWHGFLQQGTPWEDGAPGISQCPIAPRKSFTYEFTASLFGSTWYHGHYSAQYSSGVVGPIVIHGPTRAKYDVDIGPIMLSDWYHKDYLALIKQMLSPNADPRVFSDNNLINGKMNFDCSTVAAGDWTPCISNAGISKFNFRTGKTHRLRLINSGADGVQRFSIDEHVLTVIAEDLTPVQPYNTTVVTLGVGQRTDVLVTANAGNPMSGFWMRSNLTSCTPARQPHAVAAVYYDHADTSKAPTSKAWNVSDPGTCANDDLSVTQPLYPMPLPNPTFTQTMAIDTFKNASNITLWRFNGVSMRADFNEPPLLLANQGRFDFPPERNVLNLYANSSIRIIVKNNSPAAHPIHLHGHNFYILHQGPGEWDGTIVRPSNPQRRDVQQVRAFGHLVIQFDANPGVWAFHCHIAWHASGGFLSSLIVQPSKVQQMRVPETVRQTCRDWSLWTSQNVVDQIDSGT
ncbi:multicopper oxidase-domain-containing protein [Lasiosphaeria miniovina]|uniref:Multicopper oxidase-domain-containing protein n=1 Tax=Lasiosphaeria miniovina TaxID=1954250 RepID=A0AA40BGD4_9PEZI|nr:multicopper oxidase-domain-containing protein [Lasiosphaeria miniovina]KAK0733755.1 multicopper oxidase-domain-containing protein [Lasiosphaeria miniovina]